MTWSTARSAGQGSHMKSTCTRRIELATAVFLIVFAQAWAVGAQPVLPDSSVAPLESGRVPATIADGASDGGSRSASVIGPNDQIVIRVAENPDLSDKPQRVDPNGEIRLPMIGRVQAAGLTPQQLEASLTEKYKVFINEPDVMVAVLETRSQPVSVIGAVMQPGVRQLDGRKTLLQVLLSAGGASADAGPTLTLTRRMENGRIPLPSAKDDASAQFSSAEIELRPLMEGRAPSFDIELMPNDVVTISKAEQVFVIGEVGRAGPIALVQGKSISVLQAVATSGGLNRTASAKNARVLRPTPGSDARIEMPIDLQRILAGKAGDVSLQAGDILVVPDSPGKRATTRALEAAIQLGMAVGTYGLIR